jgi:guanine deaminase
MEKQLDPFMKAAFDEAVIGIAAGDGGPFGAVIVKEGAIIARAHNEVVKSNDPTAHAEIIAIRKAAAKLNDFNLKGCTLYTTGEPCPMCFSAIQWAHIDKVYYCNTKADAAEIGFDDTFITEIITGERENPIPFIHTPQVDCHDLLTQWYETPNKIPY